MSYRDIQCGLVTKEWIGKSIKLAGWVDRIREVGGVTFVLLRDQTGISQLVCESTEMIELAHKLHHEDVISIDGSVRERKQKDKNESMKTGEIEIPVSLITVLNPCTKLPFQVQKSQEVDENLRMKYRYLDLRNPKMHNNFVVRHKLLQTTRNYFSDLGFLEIETPYLGKSTPEGARDFLVPSRINQGKYYALTQSPQLYKEMLMAGGIDKYFQICRCFRDEDFRLDRQPEFTQIDIEMAFADEDDLHKVIEGLMKKVVKNCIDIEIETPFSVISYEESMVTYGTDKPDLRFDLPIKTVSQMFLNEDYKAFYIAATERKTIAAINISKDIATYSRKQSDQLLEQCKIEGVIFYFVKNKEDGIGLNFLTPEDRKLISDELSSKSGDSLVFAIGSGYQVYESLGRVRSFVGKEILSKNEELKNSFKFTWVNKFPLFLWSEDKNSLDSAQHPFTLPKMDQYIKNIDTAPLDIESCSSDLVLNGFELGSGGIRIVNAEFQKQIFEKVGVTAKDIDEQFDYLFDALSSGAPPEAGFALGVDRIAMLLTRSASLRDVIAFPKNTRGASPLTKEPSEITKEQHKEVFGE